MTQPGGQVLQPARPLHGGFTGQITASLPYLAVLAALLILPLAGEDYWTEIATRAVVYWILVAGLNLVVGFAGQLAIGYVALLTLGAYAYSVLVAKLGLDPFLALAAGGVVGGIAGVLVGLPALRLRTFYFAMTTLGFATIVTQVALAWTSVTGGGIGVTAPTLPEPFDSTVGFYLFCVIVGVVCTWMTLNLARGRVGRLLIALRDAEVAAESSGVSKSRLLLMVFLFSGVLAGVAGGLFATLQSYITPDAFTFDLSVMFFIAILIGGRGSVLGPLLGTIILTILPEVAAPLAAWSTFLYAALLLIIVLAVPGGIAELLAFSSRRKLDGGRSILPRLDALPGLFPQDRARQSLAMRDVRLSFGGVKAIDGLSLDLHAGEDHAERDLRVRQTTAGHAGGWPGLGVGPAADPGGARHRPHLPNAARGRRALGAGQRDDRRCPARARNLRRGDAGLAPVAPGGTRVARAGAARPARLRPRRPGGDPHGTAAA
jgi:branched-chain amino acid transport system permease protein